MSAVGALGSLSLVLAIENTIAHVDFIKLFVKVLFGKSMVVAYKLPQHLIDHQGLCNALLSALAAASEGTIRGSSPDILNVPRMSFPFNPDYEYTFIIQI